MVVFYCLKIGLQRFSQSQNLSKALSFLADFHLFMEALSSRMASLRSSFPHPGRQGDRSGLFGEKLEKTYRIQIGWPSGKWFLIGKKLVEAAGIEPASGGVSD